MTKGRKQIAYTRDQVRAFLEDRFPDISWEETIKRLPPVIWRARWDKLAASLGLPYSRKHLQNLDWQGLGPSSFEDGRG
jgi:hypothetical protein